MGEFSRRFGFTSLDLRLPVNPFTDAFVQEEIAYYDLGKPYSKGGVKVALITPAGRLDDYLNKNWRVSEYKVPAIAIDGELWMSLTPMEIQSAYVPIASSGGVVGTAGLGLGYFALRTASNPDVEEVHAYEIEPRVIEFFLDRFGDRSEMKKIQVHHGDVRKDALYNTRDKGPSFDFFFMDVYQTLLPDEIIDDIALFEKKASVEIYRFWGEERVLLDSLLAAERPKLDYIDRVYFAAWKDTPINEKDESIGVLMDLYEPMTDEKYRKAVLVPLGVLPEDEG